jgi:SulP family sulfate permease
MTGSEQPSGWRRYVPIAVWLAAYERGHLAVDLIAALTVWALLVPEAMAYASLAGMPPETGLYAALVAPLAYAIFGTSRQLNVGPSSTVAVLSFAVVAPLAGSDPNLFIQYTTALAILVGAMFIVAGLVKLGFIADFMSKPVLDGFIVGLALTIAAGQLHKLFGIESTGEYADNFFGDIAEVVTNLDETVLVTFVIGAASLALLFILERINEKIPAALVVTFLAIIVVSVLDLEEEGVHVIGEIAAGLPSLGWPDIGIGGWVDLIPGAIGIVIVAFAESVAAARTYARKHDYEVDADQEMVALGAANAATGLFGSFTVDGSLSKTAAADQAGQKTQFASIAVSAAVLITILFLTGLFENLPEATLGAIVIHAVWHLIDFNKVGRYWNVRRDDFWAGLVGLLGVLVFDILTGLVMAIGVSFLLLLARASRPYWSVLGRTGEAESDDVSFQSVDAHPDAETFPGLLIVRFDADLFFANASVFADDVRTAIRKAETPPRVVLIDAEAISDIDATALGIVSDLRTELASQGIELWLARLKTRVADMQERSGGYEDLVTYPSVRAGVRAFLELPEAPEDEPAEPHDGATSGHVDDRSS